MVLGEKLRKMEKGQILEVLIEDMGSEGEGIGRWEGMAVFVPGAVTGDMAEVQIVKVKKRYAMARCIEIKKASPLRNGAFSCRHFEEGCGGCGFGALGYEAQLSIKEKQVRDKLIRLGEIEDPAVKTIIGMKENHNRGRGRFRYRNKAQFHVASADEGFSGGDRRGGPASAVGFYRRKSRRVIDCRDCLLQTEAAMAAAGALRRFMEEFHVPAWDPVRKKGLIRRLIVKSAFGTEEVMAVIVIKGGEIPHAEELIRAVDEAVYEAGSYLESIVVNVQEDTADEGLGKKSFVLAGKPTIKDCLEGMEFEISPESFYQVNPVQTERLYERVREYCGLTGKEILLDIYCGVGSIGLFCASRAGYVIGIETVKSAVLDANRNAVINGIVNARYIEGRAEDILPHCLSSHWEEEEIDPQLASMIKNADVAVLDPPRAGCMPNLLEAVAAAGVKKIVYVSCDPATMARDVKLLRTLGYEFIEATPVDMFPNTGSVETVVLLSHKKNLTV